MQVLPVIPDYLADKLRGLMALDQVHAGYDSVALKLSETARIPLCIDGCGRCCWVNVLAWAIEVEHFIGGLISHADQVGAVKAACREWLIRPEPGLTFGKLRPSQTLEDIDAEMRFLMRDTRQPCPFLDVQTARCTVHWGRPLACRAYGVTHVPAPECPRPRSFAEPDDQSRIFWNGHTPLPGAPAGGPSLYDLVGATLVGLEESTFLRQGFFGTLVYERLDPADLASLRDAGKIALAKLRVIVGGNHVLLWQEELERDWAMGAHDAIPGQVPFVESAGKVAVRYTVDRNGQTNGVRKRWRKG